MNYLEIYGLIFSTRAGESIYCSNVDNQYERPFLIFT
ncbi:unnamed protein product [Schistosoma curassoni]|uniref:Ycf15 n=1 Tax=Schistosoma curassoni TaxID=6186 RepID=A0A183KV12_9TREM|nr:unnamed protein product [Schistosoma curassoni]